MAQTSAVEIQYRLFAGSETEAAGLAQKTAYEQSVELPDDVLSDEIRQRSTGKVISLEVSAKAADCYDAVIEYPAENAGTDFSQFLNILLGNASLFRGVKISGVNWNRLPSHLLKGPQFGIEGVRKMVGAPKRALSCTALKPVGLKTEELAEICYKFAMGGIDIIKDDHGLSDQQSSTFIDRVHACVEATHKAADKTGHVAHYYPNITADGTETLRRYEAAHKAGAKGVLLMPHLCGLPLLRELISMQLPLPIMAHPAFSGSYVLNDNFGFTPEFLYGSLWRLCGADFSIYPNAGGRFSFSDETCRAINHSCRETDSLTVNPAFPVPGGGVQRQSLPMLLENYGTDTVFLIGGSLYQHPKGITYASREIRDILDAGALG